MEYLNIYGIVKREYKEIIEGHWKLRRDKVASKPNEEGWGWQGRNGSTLPHAKQRLSKVEAKTTTLGLVIWSLLGFFRKTRAR